MIKLFSLITLVYLSKKVRTHFDVVVLLKTFTCFVLILKHQIFFLQNRPNASTHTDYLILYF
jgi:hypothetical protein